MDTLSQDLKYALRNLRRSPGFVATIVITFALGVGANSAMFSVVDRIFLRPPAGIPRPAELRSLLVTSPRIDPYRREGPGFSHADYSAIRSQAAGIASVAGYSYACVGCGDPLTRVRTAHATAEFLPIVALRPALGRFFTADEDRTEAGVAVISHEFWRRAFGADSAVVGRVLQVKKERYIVIGVTPEEFTGVTLDGTDAWLPLGPESSMALIARLRPEADERQLAAAASVAWHRARQLAKDDDPDQVIRSASIIPGRRPGALSVEGAITVRIAGVAAIILLITVANVATLLLMRATRRRREFAIRLALGVSRSRVYSQLVTEGLLLAVLGGAAAMLVGAWGGHSLRVTLLPLVRWTDPVVDARVIAFTLAVALTAGVLASLAPGIGSTRTDLAKSLAGSAHDGVFRRSRVWRALVVSQAALSIVLVIGAGLFVRSLRNVRAIKLGYDVEQLMVATVMFDDGDDVPADLRSVLMDEATRLSTLPGVEAAGVSSMPPMGGFFGSRIFLPSGDTTGKGLRGISWNAVSPGFFAASGMHLRAGRDFRTSNGEGAERVMIVNESMAKRVWPGQPALGQCLMLDRASDPCVAVIGVVSDSHLAELMESEPMHYFLPLAQMPDRAASSTRSAAITVRADAGHRANIAQLMQHDLRQRFPPSANVTVDDFEKQLAPRYSQWRQGAVLFSLLGAVALVLTMVGVFSVIAYMVSQRTHEMGVRIALGARGGDIVRLVLEEGLRVVAVGVGLGVGLALALGRLVASLLYDISPYDPGVLAGASLVLTGAAIVACVVPAARAMRVDPIGALRAE